MALKDKIAAKWSKALFWRLGLGALVLLCLTMGGVIWISGSYETRHAFEDGRRLVITLADGSIAGKQISSDKPTPPAPLPTPTPPAPIITPAPPAATEPAATPPPVAAAPTPITAVAAGKPMLDNSQPVTPAAVALAPANPALTEQSSFGPLPIIGADGTKPWRYYAKPFERHGSLPMIAVIVVGVGQGKMVTEGAIRLPENVTLSFSPYAKDIGSWVGAARVAGHEVLLDLPLEPSNYPASDPGPHGLLAGKGIQENASRLQWLMSRVQGFVGFMTPQSEEFSADNDAIKGLLQPLVNRGLMLVLNHEPAKGETRQLIDASLIPNVVGDVLLDEELSATAIQARMISLEKVANKNGFAIGIAQAYPLSVQQIGLWAAKLQERGFLLVPVTSIAKMRFS